MTNLIENLRRVAFDLNELGVGWAVVGGLAVAVHAEPRFTRDIDVVVATRSNEDAEKLVFRLHAKQYSIRTLLEHKATGRLSTIRLIPPGSQYGLLVDLLFASSGIEDLIVEHAEFQEVIPGLVLPVARAGHLAAMKALAFDPESRPQDFADLKAVLERASQEEIDLAFEAASEITSRGFNRGKDLGSILGRALKLSGFPQ